MYITRIEIKDIRAIDNLEIDFTEKFRSLILSGNNGSGKSTILRCIAMGISDEDSAASVLRELSGELVRKGKEEGRIKIFLQNQRTKYLIQTEIKSLPAFEKVYQRVFKYQSGKYKEIKQEDFPWEQTFIAGYGAGVRNLGTADYQYYVPIDALYSLFRYDVPLQNPELSIRRIIESSRKRGGKKRGDSYAQAMEGYLTNILKQVLNLKSTDNVILTATSIQIKSYWGNQELSTLGDGYISTVTWILDLFSWWMLHLKLDHKSVFSNKEIRGIVLIDEIEQHLHPIWQVKIMELLKNSFPHIQFISTTHSPLVISSEIDIPVLVLNKEQAVVRIVSGWLAEDIYRDIMGLKSSRGSEVKLLISEYKTLHQKKLSGKAKRTDLVRISYLKNKLINILPPHDPIVETLELSNITDFLKKANEKRKTTS